MAESEMANQAEQEEKSEVKYVDEKGKTKSRKAVSDGEEEQEAEFPEPLGTDSAALVSDSKAKAEFVTAKDAEKAEKDGTTL